MNKKYTTYKEKANEVYSMPSSTSGLQDRLDLIDEVINGDDYFVDYLSDSYTGIKKATDNLAENNQTFKLLERMADYIIMSDEGKELNNEDKENRALSTEYLYKKIKREKYDAILLNGSDKEDALIRKTKSPYKPRYELSETKIEDKDLEQDNDLGKILREYDKVLKSIDENSPFTKRKRDMQKHDIMADMIAAKKSYTKQRTMRNKWQSSIERNDDYNFLDFTDPNTIITMLSTTATLDQHENLYYATQDFYKLLQRSNLNEDEWTLYFRLQIGYTPATIEREFGIPSAHTRRVTRKNLVNKVVLKGEKYDKNDKNSLIYKNK